jgi:hypothetical protein
LTERPGEPVCCKLAALLDRSPWDFFFQGTNLAPKRCLAMNYRRTGASVEGHQMNSIIYLVGLVVVVLAVLSLIGLR